MARYTVAPGCVTATQACEWAGLDYDTYIKLVAEGWLDRTPAKGIDKDSFAALFLFSQLAKRLGFETVRHVWRQVRNEVSSGSQEVYLKIHVGIPMPTARILRSPADLDHAMEDEEPGRIIDATKLLIRARTFFAAGGTPDAKEPLMRVLEA